MKNPIHRITFVLFLISAAILASLSGCKKDEINTSPDIHLSFSTDSVKFDTVFNTVGSATQVLKVYNRDDSYVNISRVKLLNDANNSYRINVDGLPGDNQQNIEIGPKDSIYIFIEVTVEPNSNILYPFVEGKIEFETNGNVQSVDLVAWGWDAIFYVPDVFPTNGLPNYTIISDDPGATVTWTNEKPIVIYGYLVVDSLQKLIVEPGTQVFFHQGSGLWVYRGGNIRAEGSLEEPIVFQGDRLESFYDEQPGQWDRIWINEGSQSNVFKHVLIKNNFIGIQCETLPFSVSENPTVAEHPLRLDNVVIRNNSIAGILSKNYKIDASNVLLSSAGQHLLAGTGGGSYNFDNCTFANNWNYGTRQTPAVYLTNLTAISSEEIAVWPITTSRFRNCIIYGNGINEIGLDFDLANTIDLQFSNSLIRAEEEVITPLSDYFGNDIYVGQQPGFVDFVGGDFRLAIDAFVIGKGQNISLTADLIGTPYANPPSMGCFEYLE